MSSWPDLGQKNYEKIITWKIVECRPGIVYPSGQPAASV
jgi:hypothetical protein